MKKNSGVRIVLIVVGVLFVMGMILAIPYISALWNKPLGATLGLSTQTPTTETTQSTPSLGNSAQEATLTPTAAPLCGGPSTMIVEALGDNEEEALTDVIRIVRVDFVIPKVVVLDIPRDTWVQIPPLSDPKITYTKINGAFYFGMPWALVQDKASANYGKRLYDGPGDGAGLMARTLDLNFGLHVDHYGWVDMKTFVKIVDAVGGIDVYLPEAVNGKALAGDPSVPDMGYFPAGEQHLTGQQALNLARVRKCDGCTTYTRTSNQNIVLCALKDKLLTPSVLPDIPNIIASFQDSVHTDLSPAQISQLACLLPHLGKQNIVFAESPRDLFVPTQMYDSYRGISTSAMVADPEFLNIIQQFVAGTWPTSQADSGGSFCQ